RYMDAIMAPMVSVEATGLVKPSAYLSPTAQPISRTPARTRINHTCINHSRGDASDNGAPFAAKEARERPVSVVPCQHVRPVPNWRHAALAIPLCIRTDRLRNS